jgi:hypothetical protein
MLGIHRTTTTMPARRALVRTCVRPAHRRRRAWKVEYLEERSLLSLFPVTNLNDSGGGSLRQAIIDSNNNTTNEPNEIDFAPGLSGTIWLTTGDLLIANYDLQIVGPGQGSLTVSGNGNSRVFEVASGVTATLSGMIISDGKADNGGGIYTAGTLMLERCTIAKNVATSGSEGEGGGIYNLGTVTINSSIISGNNAGVYSHYWVSHPGSGGGIYNYGSMTICSSTISGNVANRHGIGVGIVNTGTMTIANSAVTGNSTGDGDGGGIVNSGAMTLTDSSVTSNVAGTDVWREPEGAAHGGGNGGGIINSGTLALANSSVSDNTGNIGHGFRWSWGGAGGGIYNGSGTVNLTNSTVAGNNGGGIWNGSGTVALTNATVAGNHQLYSLWYRAGGGICNVSGTATLATSIVAGNSAPAGQSQDGGGEFDSLGQNLIGNTQGSSGWTNTDLLNIDPMLGPLQDNGGPTMTMALLPGSPAIDAGINDLIPTGTRYDQRGPGFQRIVNATGTATATVDIGAFEWQPYVASSAVGWGNKTAPLKLAADGLHLLPEGRKTDLPWLNVQQLTITLSTPVTLSLTDVIVSSTSGTNYGPLTVSGSGTSYTITLGQSITKADRLTIKLNLAGMVSPTFELDVLPGDYNDDGVVNSQDMVGVRNEMLGLMGALPTLFGDINGDGKVDINDYTAVRQRIGSHL